MKNEILRPVGAMGVQKLSDLEVGEEAGVETLAQGTTAERFAGLGLLPGVRVKILRRAPLGDPILVEFEGQQISMRLADAAGVQVVR